MSENICFTSALLQEDELIPSREKFFSWLFPEVTGRKVRHLCIF